MPLSWPASRRAFGLPRPVLAFVPAVATTYVVASLFQTAFVLAGLYSIGARFSPMDVLRTALHDLYGLAFHGMFVSYLLLIALGFAVALPVAGAVRHWTPLKGTIIYPLAGAAMMGAMLIIAKTVFFGISLYAGTRGTGGLAGQMLAGALGGFVFGQLVKERKQ